MNLTNILTRDSHSRLHNNALYKRRVINVGFYNDFIDKLRGNYLSELVSRAKNLFRNEEGVLYSFEDITTSLGIEDNCNK